MREYGYMKATEFTKKQINVIFAKAKSGNLKVEKWFMSTLYDLADYYGYDYNRGVEEKEREVIEILSAVFANETEKAQKLINEYENKWYNLYGRKTQAECDRTLYIA